jgi:hypothetical protein
LTFCNRNAIGRFADSARIFVDDTGVSLPFTQALCQRPLGGLIEIRG